MPESQLKDLSELFNAQFSNLLTVMGGLITIFGFILPLINLYYQRQTLKEERESIKREVDRSLEVIKEQVKNFDHSLQQAKEERKTEIANVRDDLEKTINDAKNDFQSRQKAVDDKLAEHEKNRNWDNGYFLQQLAIADTSSSGKVIYYCNSLPYFSKCCTSKKIQQRFDVLLDDLKSAIMDMSGQQLLSEKYFNTISSCIKKAQDDLIDNYHFSSKLDEIKDLIDKKKAEAETSAKQTLVTIKKAGRKK